MIYNTVVVHESCSVGKSIIVYFIQTFKNLKVNCKENSHSSLQFSFIRFRYNLPTCTWFGPIQFFEKKSVL